MAFAGFEEVRWWCFVSRQMQGEGPLTGEVGVIVADDRIIAQLISIHTIIIRIAQALRSALIVLTDNQRPPDLHRDPGPHHTSPRSHKHGK